MKVSAEIIDALQQADIDGRRLVLTGPRMHPTMYQRVNEVLEAVGGRWTRNQGAHVFTVDAADAIAPVIATGQVVTLREKRTDAQYFPTPSTVVTRLVDLADIRSGMTVLEPSAGSGAIATEAAARGAIVDCFERDPGYAAVLAETGAARDIQVVDFLTVPPEPRYDRVVMNPPFTRQADVAHVQHALQFLKPDGLLVSVMSHAVTYQQGAAATFRSLVEQRGGRVEALPERAFTASGTGVSAILVSIPATRLADARPATWPSCQRTAAPEAEQFRDPAEIAQEIASNLREAMDIMDALARDLARPDGRQAKVTDLPLPAEPFGQLSFGSLGEAS
ncbi:SAM-dependent methyltransferase [Streptomyces sp. TM32]|uniref:methyltransferase n=1 Tax=Streptomyces sp. TM32 TaxID=1652669 RepID=UPI0010121CB6|nr:methyltransferase [Streptomyces sp. TM32]RXS84175.1 SAM-dependent methyltransferase [Streptomyces sp. TM32]